MVFVEAKAVGVNTSAHTVEGWASVKEVDRSGYLMLPTAFEKWLDRYKANPVMCWCHSLNMPPPIGRIISIEIVDGGLKFVAKFASTKFAQEIFTLFKEKVLRAFSVQFIPHASRDPSEEEKAQFGDTLLRVGEEVELLEISPVPVPAVASALTSKGIDPLTGEETSELPPEPPKKDVHEHIVVAQELVAQLTDVLMAAAEVVGAEEEPPAEEPPAEEPPAEEPPPEDAPPSGAEQLSLERILKIGQNISTELTAMQGSAAKGGA